MSYSADVFVADEQPTTAKWNKLWSNDASFNDGTGIADDAIIARHISAFDVSNLTADSNPYKFRAYRNAAQNTGAAGFSTIVFDTENFDTNGNFNTTNGQYTAPVNGFYQFNYTVSAVIAASEVWEIALFINGSEYSRGGRDLAPTIVQDISASDLVQMTAGQTADVRASSANARALQTGSSRTHFSGIYQSRT